MPYKDKDAARAFWRRRNTKPKRKAYMQDYNKARIQNPSHRKSAYEAHTRWATKPENQAFLATKQRARRKSGAVKAAYRRRQEEIAGRPEPEFCEVCGNPPTGRGRLHFDHCHKTGKFRGWLCHHCNCAIGYARDDAEILRSLIAYLERTSIAP